MIIRFYKSGTSKYYSPVNYMIGLRDHDGSIRSVAPELLIGDPSTTNDLIKMITRKHKYISGVIAFREEENPTENQLTDIINDFRKTFLPELDEDNFNDIWVIHSDKKNFELHFLVVCEELKTGKQLNIHPPGKRNLEFYRAFTSTQNYKYGWRQVGGEELSKAEYTQINNTLNEFINYRKIYNTKTYLTKKTSFRRPRKVSQLNAI